MKAKLTIYIHKRIDFPLPRPWLKYNFIIMNVIVYVSNLISTMSGLEL